MLPCIVGLRALRLYAAAMAVCWLRSGETRQGLTFGWLLDWQKGRWAEQGGAFSAGIASRVARDRQ
jgi:hypothetical protein